MMAKKDLVSYDPIDRFFDLREDFDSMLKDFFTGFTVPMSRRGTYPSMDVKEDKDKYTVTLEAPGIDKKDIKITMKRNELIIEGEKREEQKQEGESYIRVERNYGKFRRAVQLGEEIDQSKINAEFKNGILKINLPKSEKAKPKEVAIKIK
jgi:HSP20 family protein